MPLDAVFPERDPAASNELASSELHRALLQLNHARMTPSFDAEAWIASLDQEYQLRCDEHRFVENERALVRARAEEAPYEADAFVAWFEQLRQSGPGQNDVLFPWLANEATPEAMRWFLAQELAGEAGFEDLVALTQVKMHGRAKLELARNYWDEMGQGSASGMHGPMLDNLGRSLQLENVTEPPVWEAIALGNLMGALAANRHYAFQSLGALGVIELTAPDRAAHVNAGLKRLGVTGSARRYYALHATLDIKHSAAWNREVLHSLASEDPRAVRAIAEGALMRLHAGARCFARYRQTLMPPA
jgi:hypothetical protein